MPITAGILEMGTLHEWVSFVSTYPRPAAATAGNGRESFLAAPVCFARPNWVGVAKRFDGVHVSLSGYLAVQLRPQNSEAMGIATADEYFAPR